MLALYIMLQIRLAEGIEGARREEGQGLVEYGLILALIAILVIAALTFLKNEIADVLSRIGSAL